MRRTRVRGVILPARLSRFLTVAVDSKTSPSYLLPHRPPVACGSALRIDAGWSMLTHAAERLASWRLSCSRHRKARKFGEVRVAARLGSRRGRDNR